MKKSKLAVALLSSALLLGGLAGCDGSKPTSSVPESTLAPEADFSFSVALDNGYSNVKVGETANIVVTTKSSTKYAYEYSSSNTAVLTVSESGAVTGVSSGTAIVSVYEPVNQVTRNLSIEVFSGDPATGIVSYSDSIEEKTEIIGKLEKYAMDNNLTGISLFENGGYVMYNPRIQKGVENYIVGYGFGILSEGNITSDLASETNADWKRYYHSAESSDAKNINCLDADGSQISDLASYITASYWGTKMNANKNGYDWYPSLAMENRPVAGSYANGVFTPNADQSKKSDWFKFHVKTGSDVTFSTLSTKPEIAAFNGAAVTIDDYRYAFEALLTQSFGLYRGGELAGDADYGIVGASDYYAGTENAEDVDHALFANKVKFFTGNDSEGDYIILQMTSKVTPFYAMYGLSSQLYTPLSESFLKALGGGSAKTGMERYGTFHTSTPVDTILSLGAYTLEYWEEDKATVFKRNPNFYEDKISGFENRYKIPGVKITCYPGAQTDNTLVFKEFLAENIDAAGIPTIEYIKQYRNDPRTTTTSGDSVFKLNVNSCTPEFWEEQFGENGKITKTDKSAYWDVKPWMSNKAFTKGLNFAIDRGEFAANRGRVPSNNYFSSNYMSDPENGISYNATDAHKEAIADYYPETTGFNLSASRSYFAQAVDELVEAGDIELGTVSNPTVIDIVIEWMNPSDTKDYGEEIAGYFENAFNHESVCGGLVKLNVVNHDGTTSYLDVYYNHLMVGQYDLGFGSISGNALDPLNFLEVLKSDNSSGFTLNWGCDTSVVSNDLIYDDKPWSYDALWAAGNNWAYLENGYEAPTFEVLSAAVSKNANGEWVLTIVTNEKNSEDIFTTLYAICVFASSNSGYSDYTEFYIYYDGSTDYPNINGTWTTTANGDGTTTNTIVMPAAFVTYMETNFPSFYVAGFDSFWYWEIPAIESVGAAFFKTVIDLDAWPTANP